MKDRYATQIKKLKVEIDIAKSSKIRKWLEKKKTDPLPKMDEKINEYLHAEFKCLAMELDEMKNKYKNVL